MLRASTWSSRYRASSVMMYSVKPSLKYSSALFPLIFSNGSTASVGPAGMVLAGDEYGRTQRGNNNAYCQDNAINWIDWNDIGEDGRALTEFVRAPTAV